MVENSSQFLFLASGVYNDEGCWLVGIKNCDEIILEDKNLLDCHRKELMGNESAKDILFAINLTLDNLLNDLKKHKHEIDKPTFGVSFNIPLDVLEKIFDFWVETYTKKEAWIICLGLLKTRRRAPLSNLIKTGSLKGNSKKWAIKIEEIHNYFPNLKKDNVKPEPMWK